MDSIRWLHSNDCWNGCSIFGNYSAWTFFSPVVGVVSNQEIVKTGLYRWIHPAYTGGWVTAIGIGLGLSTWWGALLCGNGLLLIYMYRIHIEEKLLVQNFGENYLEYQKSTRKMFPGVW
jgi:protein-S-isoprenylcysteine O-methyltransferase Ste14